MAKAAALGISEMFLPAALVTESIPISIPRLLVIWFVRVALSLILTIPLAIWLF